MWESFLSAVEKGNSVLNSYVWGWPTIILILGTGLLLTVGIIIRFYEALGKEQMMEMNPVMRGFFGGE